MFGFTENYLREQQNLMRETMRKLREIEANKKAQHGEFYCLVEGGTTPPRVTHATLDAAKVEARRLVEHHAKPVRILRAMLEIKPAGRYIETEL